MTQLTPVGIGEGKVGIGQGVAFAVHGLGSCVALCLYDPVARCGGLCHVVLPSAALGRPDDPPTRFADTAVGWLLEEMAALGGRKERVVARIAGGANLFPVANPALAIGDRNVAAVREALARAGVPLRGEDVGGTAARTVVFFLADGRVEVRTAGGEARVLP